MTDKQAPLLPCPFCGGEAKFVNGDFSSPFEVRCTNCTEYQHTKLISWRGDADKKWNTRQALNGDCGGGDKAEALDLNDLCDNPEEHGFVKIHCDKCGQDNFYDPEFAETVTQCFGCMPTGGLPK